MLTDELLVMTDLSFSAAAAADGPSGATLLERVLEKLKCNDDDDDDADADADANADTDADADADDDKDDDDDENDNDDLI